MSNKVVSIAGKKKRQQTQSFADLPGMQEYSQLMRRPGIGRNPDRPNRLVKICIALWVLFIVAASLNVLFYRHAVNAHFEEVHSPLEVTIVDGGGANLAVTSTVVEGPSRKK